MNRFREQIEEQAEDVIHEPVLKAKEELKKEAKGSGEDFLKFFFKEGAVSKEAATDALPFIVFLAFLCMVYIANSHFAVNNVRNIDKLGKEVKELSWEYKSLKADLMFKSKLTEVAKQVDTLGIKELTEPPKKIVVTSDEY